MENQPQETTFKTWRRDWLNNPAIPVSRKIGATVLATAMLTAGFSGLPARELPRVLKPSTIKMLKNIEHDSSYAFFGGVGLVLWSYRKRKKSSDTPTLSQG